MPLANLFRNQQSRAALAEGFVRECERSSRGVRSLHIDLPAESQRRVVRSADSIDIGVSRNLTGKSFGRLRDISVVPAGLGSSSSSLPRTYVRGYIMPPLRG